MVPRDCGFAPLPAQVLPRVLLVEDDCKSHQLLRTILLHEVCAVLSAMTRAGGPDRVGGALDFVIVDLRLPDGDGEATLEKVRPEQRPVRVAVTAAEGGPERLRRGNELGPDLNDGEADQPSRADAPAQAIGARLCRGTVRRLGKLTRARSGAP
jgi:CheY-like chemotaxis protein